MRILRLLLFSIVILGSLGAISLRFFPSYVHAQTDSSNNTYLLPKTNPDVPHDLHTITHGIVLDLLSVITCYLSGTDPLTQNNECLGWDTKTQKIGYVPQHGGLIGFMSGTIGNTFTFPLYTARTSDYIGYLSQNFHRNGSSPVYAATPNGIGYQGIAPFLKIWVGIRNIAYLFIVIIFIFIGLGIMLRIKIDPRTVMTLQNQIPKIIIGLLLITFSFAISGLLIDLTYVLTLVFLNTIAAAVNDPNAIKPDVLLQYPDPFRAIGDVFQGGIFGATGGATTAIGGIVQSGINSNPISNIIFNYVLNPLFFIPNLICQISAIFGSGCTVNQSLAGDIINIIVYIVILIAVISALFRFWIALISAYLTILFDIVLAPLWILSGLVPGSPGGFTSWLRDIGSNLAIFPISLGFLFLAGEFAKTISTNATAFITPLTGSAPKPTAAIFLMPMVPGGGDIGSIIALAAILMLPRIPQFVLETFKVKDVFGTAVGAAIGSGVGAISTTVRKGFASQSYEPTKTGYQKLGWKAIFRG